MNRALLLAGLSISLATAACDGCNKSATDAPTADAAPAATASSSSARAPLAAPDAGGAKLPWAAIPSATAPILPNMGIPDRFQIEATSRPANIKPNVESVYAALEKAGISVVDKKQHLGQTFGARYCMGARAVKGTTDKDPNQLYLSVCEFVSNEVAEMSKTYSSDALKSANRVVHAKAQTTFTVRGESDAPEIKAQMDKALATYDAL